MDTFCGLGLPELVIIALIGFVLIGPERSRELALQLGRMLSRVMKSPWWREFNQVTDSLRNLPTTLVRMAELEEAQAEIQRELRDIEEQTRIEDFEGIGRPKPGQAKSSAEESADPWNIRGGGPPAASRTTPPQPPEPPGPEEEAASEEPPATDESEAAS